MHTGVRVIKLLILLLLLHALNGCGQDTQSPPSDGDDLLNVVATTSIVADVTSEIGGDLISLSVLLPPESDPHSYEPVPQDLGVLQSAQLVLRNGLGFEAALDPFLDNLTDGTVVQTVSDGISPRRIQSNDSELSHADTGGSETGDGYDVDPHVWFDPTNIIIWTENIEEALSLLDPDNGATYAENAVIYRQKLMELDAWIADRVSRIPVDRRLLVTDHDTLGYFAAHYDFEVIGTIIPSTSTLAEPSAQGLAQLSDEINESGIPAVFVGPQVNSSLAEQIAAETGAKIVILHTASLGVPENGKISYLDFMKFNTNLIVDALSAVGE